MQQIFLCFLFLLSAWLPASSYAQVAAPAAFDRFMWTATGGSTQSVGFGTNGQPVTAPGVPMVSTDGGLPKVTQSGQLVNPSGNRVPVTATGRVSGLQASKALAIALAKVVGPVGIGLAVYDVAKELGFTLSGSGSDSFVVKKSDPSICTVSPCYKYQSRDLNLGDGVFFPTQAAACAAINGTGVVRVATPSLYGTCGGGWGVNMLSATPSTATYLNSSLQELTDSIASKSGWPSTSNISRLLSEHQATTGTAIQPEQISVTGPATSVGKTSTTTNSNNTTTTTTTTHNHTYEGAKVNTTNITTTTVTNTATGEPISTQTTTEAPAPEPVPAETCGLPGTPICNVKVDETGVPDKTDLNPETKTTEALKDIKEFATNPVAKLPTLPTLNWSFQLPSGCVALSIPGFAPFLQSIDVCQFMPIFHDIMSIVWLMGGLFGAISMFFRNTFATQ